MKLFTVTSPGVTDKGTRLKVGDEVAYRGHCPGNNIRVVPEGKTEPELANSLCFKELQ